MRHTALGHSSGLVVKTVFCLEPTPDAIAGSHQCPLSHSQEMGLCLAPLPLPSPGWAQWLAHRLHDTACWNMGHDLCIATMVILLGCLQTHQLTTRSDTHQSATSPRFQFPPLPSTHTGYCRGLLLSPAAGSTPRATSTPAPKHVWFLGPTSSRPGPSCLWRNCSPVRTQSRHARSCSECCVGQQLSLLPAPIFSAFLRDSMGIPLSVNRILHGSPPKLLFSRSPRCPCLCSWLGCYDIPGLKKSTLGDFPGSAVVKNPPANAGDTRSIPWSGKIPHAVEQLSPCATTTEPAL